MLTLVPASATMLVVLKIGHVSESPRGLVETQIARLLP